MQEIFLLDFGMHPDYYAAFPINDPTNYDQQLLHTVTREIFAQAIGDLIAIWIWI